MTGTTSTHSDGCWRWHPICAYERGRAAERQRIVAMLREHTGGMVAYDHLADLIESETT